MHTAGRKYLSPLLPFAPSKCSMSLANLLILIAKRTALCFI